jgi:leucine dehydrogenase
MSIFSSVQSMGHEQVVFCHDKESGLKAIIAIHDTTLGPALGGTRLLPYTSEEDALYDVLRLSRGMTYKSACAGLPLGGGKAVIIADPSQKSESMFRAFGRFVASLGGRYITAEDMNTNVSNMDHVRLETSYVTGVSPAYGGSGDPSIMTALGTYYGILSSVKHRFKQPDLVGLKIAVQGVGAVGKHLCKMLHEKGAQLFVQDINEARLQEMKELYNATIITERELYRFDFDVYAPCARGATINDDTIEILKHKVIAGCANNQLADEMKHSRILKEKKILYAPDFVINAGGIINVANELVGYNTEKVQAEVANIGNTLDTIFAESEKNEMTTQEAAKLFAENRINGVRQIKTLNTLNSSFLGKIRS